MYIKAGQYLASANHVLPAEFTDPFRPLQDSAPSLPLDVSAATGASPPRTSALCSPQPRDAGGSADARGGARRPGRGLFLVFQRQGHRGGVAGPGAPRGDAGRRGGGGQGARLSQRTPALLPRPPSRCRAQVQYPYLRKQVAGDVNTVRFIFWAIPKVFPSFEFSWMLPDFRRVLAEVRGAHHTQAHEPLCCSLPLTVRCAGQEMSFLLEAQHTEQAGAAFRRDPQVHIPRVRWDLTTSRVIVTEFIHGSKVGRQQQQGRQLWHLSSPPPLPCRRSARGSGCWTWARSPLTWAAWSAARSGTWPAPTASSTPTRTRATC